MLSIEATGLERTYPNGIQALAGVSLSVPRGSVITIAGPNGAGKTTLLRILATSLLPTGGRAAILGYDVVSQPTQVRRHIAMVPQDGRPEQFLTCWQSVYCYLLARGHTMSDAKTRAECALGQLGLWELRDRMTGHMSGGQKQRTLFAMVLATGAEVLFLDEPTAGLDPIARREVLALLGELRKQATIVLTTHLLDEAEYLADQVMFLNRGQSLICDSPVELKRLVAASEKFILDAKADPDEFRGYGPVVSVADRHVLYPATREATHHALEHAVERGLTLTLQPVTLEDAYFHFIQHGQECDHR